MGDSVTCAECGAKDQLHSFPTKSELAKPWQDFLGRIPTVARPKLCARHFTADCFRPSLK